MRICQNEGPIFSSLSEKKTITFCIIYYLGYFWLTWRCQTLKGPEQI